jgi:hypothetical protein
MDERRGAEVAREHASLIRKPDETDKTRFPVLSLHESVGSSFGLERSR